ncbi:DUF3883 domain-containing protein [Zoogloea sp.]|uniref:DUF3883 domain-containing protein n=1 Tax=Zoogloea sp. TaxID=49181 RepID=UPI0035B05C3B
MTHAFDEAQLKSFDKNYDVTHEDMAVQARGQFLEAFPIKRLSTLTIDDYVIGRQLPTFCAHVEAKTRPWANIQGATSGKFGIYFGKTASDPKKTYRFTRKFGETRDEAFGSVKAALLELIELGQARRLSFSDIDENPLSQMFKAKILSLYFPERFLNVCSAEHLRALGSELGYDEDLPISEYQHLLIVAKHSCKRTRLWSNPKFMSFLLQVYLHRGENRPVKAIFAPPEETHRRVNFEDVQAERTRIGKAAEEYALVWEKQRLEGLGLGELESLIADCRDQPGYGYDFLSHSTREQRRFIEVKAVGKFRGGAGHRFFLSDNELDVSKSERHRDGYFFYLVFFDAAGQPADLLPIRAEDLYLQSVMRPASYVVSFDLKRSTARSR